MKNEYQHKMNEYQLTAEMTIARNSIIAILY